MTVVLVLEGRVTADNNSPLRHNLLIGRTNAVPMLGTEYFKGLEWNMRRSGPFLWQESDSMRFQRGNWARAGLLLGLCATLFAGASLDAQAHDHGSSTPEKVSDEVAYRPTAIPDRIVLTWTGDPSTSQAVTWRTDTTVHRAYAQIAVAEAGPKFEEEATQLDAITTPLETNLGNAHFHTAHFEGLAPKTKYVYRVGDGVNWSEWSHFTTASAEPEPFSFVYFGDAQNNIKSMWSRVIREAYSDAPKARFLLHAGDLVNRAASDGEWGEWFYAGGWIHATIPCVPTPGNHEYQEDEEDESIEFLTRHWRPQFALPEHGPEGLEESVYWIDYQGVRIVSLNSNEKHEEQREWLDKVLSDNSNRWTVITHHHPLYASKSNRDNTELRALWQPVYDKHRVDLVLQGHDHNYARSKLMTWENVPTGVNVRSRPAGTVYVVSVSGPKMYDVGRRPYMRRVAEDTQLYQIITVDGNELRYEARTAIGELYDAFTLRKRPGRMNKLIEHAPETPERRRAASLEWERFVAMWPTAGSVVSVVFVLAALAALLGYFYLLWRNDRERVPRVASESAGN